MFSIVLYTLAVFQAVVALDLDSDQRPDQRVYYSLSDAQKVAQNFTTVSTCSARPDSTSKKWTTEVNTGKSGLNLLAGQPSLLLVISMDHWYHNVTCSDCPTGPVGTATASQCTTPCLSDSSAKVINSPSFSYPNFCGDNLPNVTWKTKEAISSTLSDGTDAYHSCEYEYEVSMRYVDFCNFDVTDDDTDYRFSGFVNISVQLAQPFLSSVVFQTFSKSIGFSVRLPKTLTVTTDITVVNPNECDTSNDCNGQTCEAIPASDPRKCHCDFCHSGQFCETDTCAPRILCPANVQLNGCERDSDNKIIDSSRNAIQFGQQVFKATDTYHLNNGAYETVVGAVGTTLEFQYQASDGAWTDINEASTALSGGSSYDAQVIFAMASRDGDWSFPTSEIVNFRVKDPSTNQASQSCSVQVTVNDVCDPQVTCGALFYTNQYGDVDTQFSVSTTTRINWSDGLVAKSNLVVTRVTDPATIDANTVDQIIEATFCVSDGTNTPATCCVQNINLDTTPPSIDCNDVSLNTEDYHNYASHTISDPTKSDPLQSGNSDSVPSGIKNSSYTVDPSTNVNTAVQWNVGTTSQAVKFTVEDNAGNQDECVVDVTVTDNLQPRILCSDQTKTVPSDGNTFTFSNYVTNAQTADTAYLFTSYDNVAIDSTQRVWTNKPSNNVFPLGTTTITLKEYDTAGLSAEETCDVKVTDPHPPALTCPSGSVTVSMETDHDYADVRQKLVDIWNTRTDNNQVDVASTELYITRQGDTQSVTNLYSELGSSTSTSFRLTGENTFTAKFVIYDTAIGSDSANDYTCSVTYVVRDNQAPVANCPFSNGLTVQVPAGSDKFSATSWNPVDYGLPAHTNWGTDNYGMSSVSYSTSSFSPSATTAIPHDLSYRNPETAYTVTVTVTDDSINQNTDTCTFSVTVKDPVNPSLVCNDLTITGVAGTNDNGMVYGEFAAGSAYDYTASDNVNIDSDYPTFNVSPNSQFQIGATTVTGTVKDTAGNTGTCTFTVTVTHVCGDNYRDVANEECDGDSFCDSATCECDGTNRVYDQTVARCVVPCTQSSCQAVFDCAIALRDWSTSAPSASGSFPLIWETPATHWDTAAINLVTSDYFSSVDMTFEWYPYNSATCDDPTPATRYITFSSSNPSDLPMRVGDTFEMSWPSGETHTIYRMASVSAYEQCDFSGASQVGASSPFQYEAVGSDENGAVFFASFEQCTAGYKVHFDVVAASLPLDQCVSATADPVTDGEYFEAKICCTDMPTHALEAIVFSDTTDESSYVNALDDCEARGNTGLSIVAGSGADTGCWYVPICSPGVVKVGLVQPDTYDEVQCKDPQTAVNVDMVSGDCATVTYTLNDRYTVTQGDITSTWTTGVAASQIQNNACVGANTGSNSHSVTFYVTNGTDAQGGISITCQFDVTVNDKVDPTFVNCPSDSSVNMDSSQAYASYNVPSISWKDETSPTSQTSVTGLPATNVSGLTPMSLFAGLEFYRLSGPTEFSYTVYDHNNNDATCSWVVTPVDNQLPVLTCPNEEELAVDGTNHYDFGSITIACSDNVDGDCSFQYSAGQKSVVYFEDGGVNEHSYTISYTDSSNNIGSCTGTLKVKSEQDPDLTCPDDMSIDLPANSCSHTFTITGSDFTFSDNDGSNTAGYDDATSACHLNGDCLLLLQVEGHNLPHSFALNNAKMAETLTARVTERKVPGTASKRYTECDVQITIVDTTAPTVTCPTSSFSFDYDQACVDTGRCTSNSISLTPTQISSMDSSVTVFDACDSSASAGTTTTTLDIGQNNVDFTPTASGGGPSTGTTRSCVVTVVDKIPPTKDKCPSTTTLKLSDYTTDNSGQTVDYSFTIGTDVEYTDNYDTSVSYKKVSILGDTSVSVGDVITESDLQPGTTYTFSYKACDAAGNCGPACTWQVTLEDDVAPSLTCPDSTVVEATGAFPAYSYTWSARAQDDYFNLDNFVWTLNNDGITATNDYFNLVSQVSQANVNLPLGESGVVDLDSAQPYTRGASTFTLQVKQGSGAGAPVRQCSWTVRVIDTTAPTVSCASVQDLTARPTAAGAAVIVNYPTTLDSDVSATDVHDSAVQVVFSPLSGTSFTYDSQTAANNVHDVTITATDDKTVPNLDTSQSCFTLTVLEPYPDANVDAALTRVRVLYDDTADAFSMQIDFISGSYWPYSIHKSATDPVIVETGADGSAVATPSTVQSFTSGDTKTPTAHCMDSLAAHSGTDASHVCFQNWELTVLFGSCDPKDMTISIYVDAECDTLSTDDCTVDQSKIFTLTFAGERYCENILTPVAPDAQMDVFGSTDSNWVNFNANPPELPTVVAQTDIPSASEPYNTGDNLVSLFSVYADDVLIESVTYLSLTRKACADAGFTLCDCAGDRAGDVDQNGVCPYGQSTVYDSSVTDAQAGTAQSLGNNFAFVSYQEADAAPLVTVNVQLTGTVTVGYRLSSGTRRRSVLSYEMMHATAPDYLAPMLPKPRRGLLQGGDLLETSSEASVGLSFGVAPGGADPSGDGTSAAQDMSEKQVADIPIWVWVLIVVVTLVCVCVGCFTLSCFALTSMKKKGQLKDEELETREMELAQSVPNAEAVTNIYLSPNLSSGGRGL